MDRKQFILKCSAACLGVSGITALLSGCGSTHIAKSSLSNNILTVFKDEFINPGKIKPRNFIILRNNELKFPIVVYKNGDSNYNAFLLRCTHQGNELTVNGDILTCSAHGSEFDKKGTVIQGPAAKNLLSFPVTTDNQNLYIQLT
ncbi:MAG: Rieske (2Fe-2S) protein [Segetibacter sp.]